MDLRNERDALRRLADLLARLPGIGEKTALRLALAIVRSPVEYADALANAILGARSTMRLCASCNDLSESRVCTRCSDLKRDARLVCVVAQPQDRMAIERSGLYRGLYHVLHGVLDPLSGIGPEQLRIGDLVRRIARTLPSGSEHHAISGPTEEHPRSVGTAAYRTDDDRSLEPSEARPDTCAIEEVIIATSPNVEGDATAVYIAHLLRPLGVRVTRIASGIAVGGELEYADPTSLHRAFSDRRALE